MAEYVPSSDTSQITASWENSLSNAVSVGTIIGAFANGYFTARLGYCKVLLASLAAITVFIFVPFFAPNLPVLLVGKFFCGIPWGVFATMVLAYALEICPMALRGYLTVYVNLCLVLGQLISAGVQSGFNGNSTEWRYHVPFAIQWAWPILLFLILFFAPESPWYFIRRGDHASAERNMIWLWSGGEVKQHLVMMIHTNELEKQIDQGTSY